MIRLHLSDDLSALADAFLREWEEEKRGADPFARTTLVTPGRGRGFVEWLRGRCFGRPGAFWSNVRVTGFPRFMAELARGGTEPPDAPDPWGPELLPWRIDRVFRARAGDFPELSGQWEGTGDAPLRRWLLACRVSETFQRYRRVRPEMLRIRWSDGETPAMEPVERWQARLWAALRAQEWDGRGDGAVWDFLARGPAAEAGPLDLGVHLFLPCQASRLDLAMLRRLGQTRPVHLYVFDPSREYWADDPSWREAWREERARLAEGRELPPSDDAAAPPPRFGSASHPLLGSLGLGLRATLGELADWIGEGADAEDLHPADAPGGSLLARLQGQIRARSDEPDPGAPADASLQLHVCHSPRREMEVLLDGIRTWLHHHPGAQPRDVLVLCADYETYVPHIDAVFGPAADSLPHDRANLGLRAASGLANAWLSLLEFVRGPFGVNAALDLLGNPAIASRFGLDEESVAALREVLERANIHWGYDAAHVRDLASPHGDGDPGGAFAWRPGLDRLLLGALHGPAPEGGSGLIPAGELGELLPMGDLEGESARRLGCLAEFVDALRAFGKRLEAADAAPLDADAWSVLLEDAIAGFIDESAAPPAEAAELHRAVESLRSRLSAARAGPVETSVALAALNAHFRDTSRGGRPSGNAVRFEPLRDGAPLPARLVWVCGLNDRAFPRPDRHPAFDLVARHPARGDPSDRRADSAAFLQALMQARDTFAMSHVGVDERDKHEIPPSGVVSLLDDYVRDRFGRPIPRIRHRLQGFDPAYFAAPPAASYDADAVALRSWNAGFHAAAAAFAAPPPPPAPVPDPDRQGLAGFDLDAAPAAVVPVSLAALADFFCHPAQTILRRWRVRPPFGARPLDDAENFGVFPSRDALDKAAFAMLSDPAPDPRRRALRLIQEGEAADVSGNPELLDRLAGLLEERLDLLRSRIGEAGVPEAVFAPGIPPVDGDGAAADPAAPRNAALSVVVPGLRKPTGGDFSVRLEGCVTLAGWGGLERTVAVCDGSGKGALRPRCEVELWLRHLLASAAGLGLCSTTLEVPSSLGPLRVKTLEPMPPAEAEARLRAILQLAHEEFRPLIPFWPGVSRMAFAQASDASQSEREKAAALENEWSAPGYARTPPASYRENELLWGPPELNALPNHPQFGGVAKAFWTGYDASDPEPVAKPERRRGGKGGKT